MKVSTRRHHHQPVRKKISSIAGDFSVYCTRLVPYISILQIDKDVIYVWHFLYGILLIKTMVMLLVQNVRILLYCTRLAPYISSLQIDFWPRYSAQPTIYQQVLFVKILIVSFSLRRHHAQHVHLIHTILVQSGIYSENRYFPPLFLQYK